MAAHGASVAAHSPDTAAAGLAVLDAGGTAADAAVAMTLAACVVEPFVVSVVSGMHAVHGDPDGRIWAVDGFVDVPARTEGGRSVETAISFGGERVPYTIGGSTFGTPALLPGCGALHARFGRLAWADVVAPAVGLAETGYAQSERDASLLEMLEPVMTIGVGREVFCLDGRLKREGERVVIPELAGLLADVGELGPDALNTGPLAADLAAFCADVGSMVTSEDLAAAVPTLHRPPTVWLRGWRVASRRGLSPLTDWVAALEAHGGSGAAAVAASQGPRRSLPLGTTSLAAADASGAVCAVTASTGLGTGDWFRGCHLNSMLGEVDLRIGGLRARARMGSMMAPSVLVDPAGRQTAVGAAGGSRIPSAMLRTLDGVVEGADAVAAVHLPRIHRVSDVVHVEPHLSEGEEAAIASEGFTVRRWDERHHYFGGVSVAGAVGACGDPRRGGAALTA